MKKAVIASGGKQYLVAEGETISVELLKPDGKSVEFEPLLVFDETVTTIGSPAISGAKVTAEVVADEVKAEKVVAIRYKAKKRVRKTRGHRQRHTEVKITKISLKA